MKVTEVEEGMKFILDTGVEVQYTGNGIFRDVKTHKKYLEDNLPGQIKYTYEDDNQVNNEEDIEPLEMPTMNFGGPNKQQITTADGGSIFHSESEVEPLTMPEMDFSGQAEVVDVAESKRKDSNEALTLPVW